MSARKNAITEESSDWPKFLSYQDFKLHFSRSFSKNVNITLSDEREFEEFLIDPQVKEEIKGLKISFKTRERILWRPKKASWQLLALPSMLKIEGKNTIQVSINWGTQESLISERKE